MYFYFYCYIRRDSLRNSLSLCGKAFNLAVFFQGYQGPKGDMGSAGIQGPPGIDGSPGMWTQRHSGQIKRWRVIHVIFAQDRRGRKGKRAVKEIKVTGDYQDRRDLHCPRIYLIL